MILLELFNSKIPYEVKRETSGQFKTEAMINGRKIVFRAELYRGPKGEYWDVSFEEQVDKHNVTYGKTGSGKAFEVMAMVKASLTEFRDRYHPETVYFSADNTDGTARANVYRRMVGQVLKGYELEETIGAIENLFVYRRA
jgi:ABC-type lipoprotein export system ATPase subunit